MRFFTESNWMRFRMPSAVSWLTFWMSPRTVRICSCSRVASWRSTSISRRTLQGKERSLICLLSRRDYLPRKLLNRLLTCFFDRIVHFLNIHLQFGDQDSRVVIDVLVRFFLQPKCLIKPVGDVEFIIEELRKIILKKRSW